MNYTDPLIAKVTITGICLVACAVSFILGRMSTWAFGQTEKETSQNEEGQE